MSIWAVVPVKPLRRGKSRLADVLTTEERSRLNFSMLTTVLKTLSQVELISQILVVSRDPAALALARELGCRTVREEGVQDLNAALKRASFAAKVYGAKGILIIPADLPLVTNKDFEEFLALIGEPPEVVIAPDKKEGGTNALYINPIGEFLFMYGEDSYNIHINQAKMLGMKVKICKNESIALDIDLPEDLNKFWEIKGIKNEV
ncbi:MAG: 2-phospho-L-lactate guanylyltransferase [Bacteroidales bacterium]|nr:2-phospho-L-lactate guanylyltransferase [Bacteroidales bacterium]